MSSALPSIPLVFLPVLICALTLYKISRSITRNHRSKRLPLPPGPFRWPVVGNVFDIPRRDEWITFSAWRSLYGNIISLSTFGRSIIILNSAKVANDLLDKRSSIYSDRPRLEMAGDLMGYEHSLTLTPYNERFRETRRIMKGALGPGAVRLFEGLQERECAQFLVRVLHTPEQFLEHIRHAAGAIVLSISYGYDASESTSQADPLVKLAQSAMDEFAIGSTPGAFLVDFLPWLKHIPAGLPGMGFRRKAALWRQHLLELAEVPYHFTKSQMAQGIARTSFVSKLLDDECKPEMEEVIKWAAMSLNGGGADTTVASISSFFLAMCTHPHVQRAGQEELDSVIGRERLPSISDRAQLPYIDAMVKELLRWAPVVPLALHRVMKEDTYERYTIPAGSLILANIWGFLHDPSMFPNPDEFQPERFMGEENHSVRWNACQLAFGFGRRICPGQHLAEPFLFICIAMTLATFNITKARDEHGSVIEPELKWTSGTIRHPTPFKCRIVPRSADAVSLVKRVVAAQRASPPES